MNALLINVLKWTENGISLYSLLKLMTGFWLHDNAFHSFAKYKSLGLRVSVKILAMDYPCAQSIQSARLSPHSSELAPPASSPPTPPPPPPFTCMKTEKIGNRLILETIHFQRRKLQVKIQERESVEYWCWVWQERSAASWHQSPPVIVVRCKKRKMARTTGEIDWHVRFGLFRRPEEVEF